MSAIPSQALSSILVTANVVTTVLADVTSTKWLLTLGYMPDTPDSLITLYDTGGAASNPKWAVDFPNVQCIVRGNQTGYEAAYRKAQVIKETLLGINPFVFDGSTVVAVNLLSDISLIHRDEKSRPKFSMNFHLIVEPSSDILVNRDPLEYTGL